MELKIRVQPRASRSEVVGWRDGVLSVRLTAPPVEGAANDALVLLLARTLGRGRADIHILRGLSGRKKTVRVAGAKRADLLSRIEES